MNENAVAAQVVDAAVQVHRALGPGLLESVYETALCCELVDRGLTAVRQRPVPIRYKDQTFDEGFRADVVVNDLVILELKSVERIAPVHLKQLATYLRLADKRLGLLLNFGAVLMKDGIRRVVNGLEEEG